MTSQTGLQTRAVDILPSVSQSKGNQTMKFGEMKWNLRRGILFFQKLCGTWGRETSSRLLFILLKSLIWGETKWSAA